jgi:hypothetical protein
LSKKPPKLRPDTAEIAYRVMLEATGQAEKTPPPGERTESNAEAVRRGSRGGRVGGKARAKSLTKKQRSQIAQKAADARWRRSEGQE